jgi:hypothetical protein
MAMLLLKLFQLIAKVPGVKAGMMLASRTEPLVQGKLSLTSLSSSLHMCRAQRSSHCRCP